MPVYRKYMYQEGDRDPNLSEKVLLERQKSKIDIKSDR